MTHFTFKFALIEHIPAMHSVRMSVKENALSNPLLVTEQDYVDMLSTKGNGWACFAGENLLGFSIVDLHEKNIWALFVAPGFESQRIGRNLHDLMLDWSFEQDGIHSLWLSTAPGTRAERFYQTAGWKNTGRTKSGEVRFEMEKILWKCLNGNAESPIIKLSN